MIFNHWFYFKFVTVLCGTQALQNLNTMKLLSKRICWVFLLSLLMVNCSKRTITRISTDPDTDLSGSWNEADSKRVAEVMAERALHGEWREDFVQRNNRKPVVIVGFITNKSPELVGSEAFIQHMEDAFVTSGMVRIVQNSIFREKIREERADQQEFASPETQKRWGIKLGADFLMSGTINTMVASEGEGQVTFYQIDLELADLEINELVWSDGKEIKKYIGG